MQGILLWFNEAKNHGFIETEDGERLYAHGSVFPGGKGLVGRCKGLEVTFEVALVEGVRSAIDVALVPYVAPARARRRQGSRL